MHELDSVPHGYVNGLFDVTDRVAVVTGGGSGLGAAIALGYAQAGASVVILDIDDVGAQDVLEVMRTQGSVGTYLPCDVTDKAAVDAAAASVKSTHGRADILVNSAGTAYRCPAEELTEERFDFILKLNLKGTFLPSQAFGRLMLDEGSGSIINIASIGGFVAYPLASPYLASKGAVVQLTKSLSLEWRERGVRVNGIAPTLMESPLTRSVAKASNVTADFIKARMIRPQLGLARDLVGAAIFLASDASRLVTGHTIMCDDGYVTT